MGNNLITTNIYSLFYNLATSRGLLPNDIVFMYEVYKAYDEKTTIYYNVFGIRHTHLSKLGYLVRIKSNGTFKLTPKGRRIIENCIQSNFEKSLTTPTLSNKAEFETFCNTYRELFPKGIKSGNRSVRGDKVGVEAKMKSFLIKYPEFSKELILKATTKYIKELKNTGYAYMTCADYLIEKDRNSQLAALCDEYDDSLITTNEDISQPKSI